MKKDVLTYISNFFKKKNADINIDISTNLTNTLYAVKIKNVKIKSIILKENE